MSIKISITLFALRVNDFLGTWYQKKVSTQNFRKIILIFLLISTHCCIIFAADSFISHNGNSNYACSVDKTSVCIEKGQGVPSGVIQKKINKDHNELLAGKINLIGSPVVLRYSELENDERGIYSVSKIYDTDEYSAFTDLIRFNDAFYCSFRVGSDHAGGEDGKVRIIRSVDGIQWENIAVLEKPGVDLRDPKLSVTPDCRLMVIMGGSVYENRKLLARKPHISFSDADGRIFSSPQEVKINQEGESNDSWIWRVVWHGDTGYGIDYQTKVKDHWNIFLMKTTDGKTFEKVSRLEVDGQPNEATIRFDQYNFMYVLIRREGGDKLGVLAKSPYPYTDWSYNKLDFRLGGPNFLFLNDSELVIGTRKYADKVRTQILVTDLIGNVKKEVILPSGGDTSYPGLVIYEKELWVSYYSSHEGNASIYLAKIPLSELN